MDGIYNVVTGKDAMAILHVLLVSAIVALWKRETNTQQRLDDCLKTHESKHHHLRDDRD